MNYQQDDWTSLLALGEFAYNNSTHASTHKAPFYINYGYHPKIDMLPTLKGNSSLVENFAKHQKELYAMVK